MESCPPAVSSDTVDAGGYALWGHGESPPSLWHEDGVWTLWSSAFWGMPRYGPKSCVF